LIYHFALKIIHQGSTFGEIQFHPLV